MKVAEGVYRVDGPRGFNAYVAETSDGLALVDTGMPGGADRILATIRDAGHEPGDLHWIVLTHSDPDHIGSVAAIAKATGARIAIHAADAPALRGMPVATPSGWKGALFRVVGVFFRVTPAEPDRLLEDGDVIGGLRVMHVPGHTAGSIALVREDGVVFSGDTLLGDGSGSERPPTRGLARDVEQAMAQADRIRALGYTTPLPGHGEPVHKG